MNGKPKEIEDKIAEFWARERIYEKTKLNRAKTKKAKKFFFLDGPPYATGSIHVGTAMNKVLKDFYIRFFRMQGFDVWDQPGYDTHGVPIENKVEKLLGFKVKSDIERFGVENFIKKCREFATEFIDVMGRQFANLGVWMDWRRPYTTLDNEYIEGTWFTFKRAFEKGLLYRGTYSVHVCPKCVDPKSTILVDGGTKKIGELKNCWKHNSVICVDIESKKLEINKPLGYIEHEDDSFALKTKSNKTIIASPDHPFWTKKGWVPLSMLKSNERVAIYNHVESFLPKIIEKDKIILDEQNIKSVLESFEIPNIKTTKKLFYENSASKIIVKEMVYELREQGYSYSQIIRRVEEKTKIVISKSWISKILKTKTKTRYDFLLSKLKENGVIPLHSNDKRTFILARILGHIFGDGTLSIKKSKNRKFPMFILTFTGKRKDLLEIKKDLESLGYRSTQISTVLINSVVNGRPIKGLTTFMRCYSSSLAMLLISLGAPIGRKTQTKTIVPNWIENNKKLIREFLSAYFGSELDIIKTRKSGKGFEVLRLYLTKEIALEKNGLEFAKKICELINKFGVTTNEVKLERKTVNGKEKAVFTISIDCNDDNIIRFSRMLGYEYCEERKVRASYALGYLLFKKRIERDYQVLKNKILRLKKSGLSCRRISIELSINELYVRHVVYGKSKSVKAARYMPTFQSWLQEYTVGLNDGLVWDEVDSIKYIGKRKVCDIAVERHHNFITNGFLTHNCETAVSYNEIEYKEVDDNSIYMKFKVRGRKNEYLAIWTTTAWTLPSNTGVMANPEAEYVRVDVGKDVLIVGKPLLENLMKKFGVEKYKVLESLEGKKLEGLQYEHPLADVFEFQRGLKNAHRVVLSEQFVSLEEGTGLVHTAPGHGQEDYKVGKETGLPIVNPLKMDGTFGAGSGKYTGVFAKDADKMLVDELKHRGLILAEEKIRHDYPMCWRCESPLLMMAVPQWFFRVTEIRGKLLEENAKINWVPDWAGQRFKNWLESLGDWPVSRQRYWGIPLPIWVCENEKGGKKCGSIKVIGSRKELPKVPKDFHKPYIDQITIRCDKCNGVMRRVPDVLDVWFDSGAAPWASLGYPEKKELFKKLWPVDFILEGPDQIRGWWNSLMINSIMTFNRRPFDNVLFHGFVLDAHGDKMSKSKGNIVTTEEAIEKYGRDVLRFYYLSRPVWDDMYFSVEDLKELAKQFVVVRNTFNFVKTYVQRAPKARPKNLKKEDKWLLSRLNAVVAGATESCRSFVSNKAANDILEFVLNDFSRWYIKLVRDRVWPEYDGKDKEAAFYTLFVTTEMLARLLAPFCPYLTENVYQEIIAPLKAKPKKRKTKESVHMEDWPKAEKKMMNEKLEKEMEVAKQIVESSYAARSAAGIKLRWPVGSVVVVPKNKNKEVVAAVKGLKEVLENMCNAKAVVASAKAPTKREFSKIESSVGDVFVETRMDEKLLDEALFRELVREVQEMRKKNKFQVSDRIWLTLASDEKTSKFLKRKEKELVKEVGAAKVEVGKTSGKFKGKLKFKSVEVEIAFDKK